MSSPYADILRNAIEKRVFVKAKNPGDIVSLDGTHSLPWIFDFRAAMCDSEHLNAFAELFWERSENEYPFQVCGMETAGIALVAAICMKGHERNKPVNGLYVRKSRKKYGLMKAFEGTPTKDPVIFVDDLINTGQSVQKVLAVLHDEGLTLRSVFTILGVRSLDEYAFLDKAGITYSMLFLSEEFGVPLVKSQTPIRYDEFDVLWTFKSGSPSYQHVVPKSAPALDASHVYFGSDDGILHALDQKTGAELWKYRIGMFPFGKGIFSTPAVANKTVYFGAYDGNMYALASDTGKRRWVYRDADWIGSSPAVAPDLGLLYIGLEFGLFNKRGGIAALSLDTGEEKWAMRSMNGLTHCSPLYMKEERAVVIGSNDGSVYCFDAHSGNEQWTYKTNGSVKSSFAYDAKRRLVIFGSFDGNVYALRAKDGKPVWHFDIGEAIFSTPCLLGDYAYMPSLNKYLFALSLDSGEEKWRFQMRGRIFSSPVIADNSLWIGSNDGRLCELDPATGTVRSFFQTSERIVNAVAYNAASKTFFVPTQANELYSIKRKNS
ncbi:MAG: quinonprotein alcohol dehydrogenase [Parcubacteria group bacterium Gr01-1014_8]|nr:MAG: quinonprotein alcohol dehydrogenase [Parcubacteria group bacterium Gr01-1014_8]